MSRIEPVQTQTTGSHLVQDRSLQVRMTVVPDFVPSMIVTHQKDDVRSVGRCRRDATHQDEQQDKVAPH